MRKQVVSVVAMSVMVGATIIGGTTQAGAQSAQLQELLDRAAATQQGVDLPEGASYVVDKPLEVKPGVRYINGNNARLDVRTRGTEKTYASAFHLDPGVSGVQITNMSLDMEHSRWSSAISMNGVSNVVVRGLTIDKVNFRGISVLADAGDVNNIAVEHNRINAISQHEDVVPVFVSTDRERDEFTSMPAHVWQRYSATGKIAKNKYINQDVRVSNNVIENGYYGVKFSGVTGGRIAGNTVRNNERNVSLQDGSNANTVVDNQLRESKSSAVHIAYDSDDNHVRNNTVVSHRAQGQGMLQAYQGSNGNKFEGNSVTVRDAKPSWLLYVGTDSHDTSFANNTIDGRVNRAMIGVESVWDRESSASNLPEGWTANRSSYAVKGQSNNPAKEDIDYAGGRGELHDISITGNTITPRNHERPVIYVGAEVSQGRHKNEKLIGNIHSVTVTGNTITTDEHAGELVQHTGVLVGVGAASITGLNHR